MIPSKVGIIALSLKSHAVLLKSDLSKSGLPIVTGIVDGGDDTDTLRFGGTGPASFGLGDIGATQQYRNFETFEQTGGEWAFSGVTTENFTVSGGTLKGTGTFADLSITHATCAPGNSNAKPDPNR